VAKHYGLLSAGHGAALCRVFARAPYLDVTRYEVAGYYRERERGLPRAFLWTLVGVAVLTAHMALVAAVFPNQKATPTVNQPPPQAVMIDLEPFSASLAADKAEEAHAAKKDSSKVAKLITPAEDQSEKASGGKTLAAPLDLPQKTGSDSQSAAAAPSKSTKLKGAGQQSAAAQKKGKVAPAKARVVSPPKLVAEASPRASEQSPLQGSVGQATNIPSSWRNALYAHLNRFKHYPQEAKDERRQGSALLSFTLDRDGKVLDFFLVRSSGDAALDREVLGMIERASPLPPPPPEAEEANLHLVVPIQFSLK